MLIKITLLYLFSFQDAKITDLETQVMTFELTINDLQGLPDTVTDLETRVQTLENAGGKCPRAIFKIGLL